jgi:molybdopterin-guanine dinucleotide biosynthesis protein A
VGELHDAPAGVVLAGGRGRRIGGAKAIVKLAGRPLIDYPLATLGAVLPRVAVVAKSDTELPPLPGVAVWLEDSRVRHPAVGIRTALARAGGPVLVCAADLPFVTVDLLERLLAASAGASRPVIASAAGVMQPLLGCYPTCAAAPLEAAHDRPLRELVAELQPHALEVENGEELFNVNTAEDLVEAHAILERRGQITRR